jgi:hypothetical protein
MMLRSWRLSIAATTLSFACGPQDRENLNCIRDTGSMPEEFALMMGLNFETVHSLADQLGEITHKLNQDILEEGFEAKSTLGDILDDGKIITPATTSQIQLPANIPSISR